MYIYGCFMLKFDREQQKSVKQLSFKLKINLNKKPPPLPKKSRDITLPTKVHIVKAMDFPVVMSHDGCESWIIRKG